MSLMESIRSGTDSTLVQIVFFMVVISFVGWGVGVTGDTTTTVASVNGEPIYGIDFSRAVRVAEQRYGGEMDEDARDELRERVLQDMIRTTALLQEAEALGLEVSNKEIAAELLNYTFLMDENEAFDVRAYKNFLRRQGLTQADFEQQLREQLMIQKLQNLMMLGASVSHPIVRRDWVEANTKVEIRYVRVRPSAFYATLEPTDAELDTWIEEHPDEIQARYDQDLSRTYDLPETVDVSLVRLVVRGDSLGVAELTEKMNALRDEIEEGADFADMARRWSEDPSAVDGGVITELKVPSLDEQVASALAELEPGQLSKVVATPRDVRLYRLDARTEARVVPLDEVKRDIATVLYRETEAPTRAATFADEELLPAWTEAGEVPEALLAPHGLRADTTGLVPISGGTSLIRPPERMMKAARRAEVGDVLPEVYEEDGVLWVGAVVDRQDADLTAFEDNEEELREQALLRRRVAFMQAWADEVVAEAAVTR